MSKENQNFVEFKPEAEIEDPDRKMPEVEAARWLGIGHSTLRRIRAMRKIGYYRWNSKTYYSVEQLKAYQNAHEFRPAAAKRTLSRKSDEWAEVIESE